MLYNLDSKHDSARNGENLTTSDRLKSCCHHSLQDLCVHTDGAWLKNILPVKTYITVQMDVAFV